MHAECHKSTTSICLLGFWFWRYSHSVCYYEQDNHEFQVVSAPASIVQISVPISCSLIFQLLTLSIVVDKPIGFFNHETSSIHCGKLNTLSFIIAHLAG